MLNFILLASPCGEKSETNMNVTNLARDFGIKWEFTFTLSLSPIHLFKICT